MSPAPRFLSREALLAFVVAILVSMAFFPQAWFQGKSLYSTDLILQREPWKTEWEKPVEDPVVKGSHRPNPELGDLDDYFFPQLAFAVRTRHETGHWPLWNPEIYAGVPLIGNPQIPLWNPFLRVLPLFQEADRPFSAWRLSLGLTWTGILRFVFCIAFAYLWLRRLGASLWIAGCIALFLGAGPYAALWRFSTPEQVFSLMPMVLYFLEGLRERWNAPSLVATSLAFGLSCLGGYPQTSLVFGLFLLPWAWWRSKEAQVGARAGMARVALSLGLGGALALPCWLPLLSYMGESSVGDLRAAAATAALSSTWFPNLLPILFPNFSLAAPDFMRAGIETHQAAIGFPLFVLLLMGLWHGARGLLVTLGLLLLLHLDFAPLSQLQRWLLPLLEPSRVAAAIPLVLAFAWYRADHHLRGHMQAYQRLGWNLLALLALLWPGIGFHPASSENRVYPETATIRFLKAAHAADPDLRLFQVDAGLMDRNAPLVFDLPLVLGTDGMDPKRYVFLVVHLLPEDKVTLSRTAWTSELVLQRPLFDQFAARLILVRKGQRLPEHFRVLRRSGELLVVENPRAAPRAELFANALPYESDRYRLLDMKSDEAIVLEDGVPPLPGPVMTQGEVRITERSSDRLHLVSEADGASYLLLRDNLLTGWQARIDGESVPILRGNFTFRSLVLPKGKHEIEFFYAPASYVWGRWLALLALVILGGILLTGLRPRSGSPAPEAAPSRS